MKLLTKYKNGNYTVKLFEDGTKIRYNNLNNLTPDFAESIDMNISTVCNGHCKYCYLNCTENGKHGDLNNHILNTLHAGTEIAINANDMTHPGLEDFLIRMKDKGVFVNITINQKHLKQNVDRLKDLQSKQLIWGIGISLTDSSDKDLISNINKLNNVVIHVIDGCFTKNDIENLKNNNLKLLFLGFKHKGRGIDYYNQNKDFVNNNINFLRDHLYDYRQYYNCFAFDSLALDNLDIKNKVSDNQWKTHHMGNEGQYTMFVDLVNNTYAISSMNVDNIYPINDIDTIDTIFKHIRQLSNF